jgi:hypothetical protein
VTALSRVIVRSSDALCIAVALALAVVLAFLGAAIWPAADDFCSRMFVDSDGVKGALEWLWGNWSGRLATSAVLYSLLALLPMEQLRWVSVVLGLLLPVLAWQMATFWKPAAHLRLPLFAVILAVLCWGLYPLMGQTVFWFTGGIVYLLPLILLLHWLGSVRTLLAEGEGTPRNAIYWFVLSVFVGNSIELVWPVLFAYLVLNLPRAWRTLLPPVRRAIVWRTGGLLLGAALLLASPGNYRRARVLPGSFEFDWSYLADRYVTMLQQSLLNAILLWGGLLALLIVAGLLGALLRDRGGPIPANEYRAREEWRAIGSFVAGALLSLTPVLPVPAFYTPRNALYLDVFLLLAGIGVAVRLLWQPAAASASAWATSTLAVLALLIAGLGAPRLYRDIDPARTLRTELQARDSFLQDAHARGVRNVKLPAVKAAAPSTVHFVDFFEDPKEWLNWCSARYYKLDSIQRQGRPAR